MAWALLHLALLDFGAAADPILFIDIAMLTRVLCGF